MKSSFGKQTGSPDASTRSGRGYSFAIIGSALVALIALILPRPKSVSVDRSAATHLTPAPNTRSAKAGLVTSVHRPPTSTTAGEPAKSPEEIVAEKVRQFGRKRYELAQAIARRSGKDLPPEIQAFFDAIEQGNWDEIHSRWRELATHTHQYEYSKSDRPDLEPYWAMVLDAYGVAEQAHEWPAQQLLDYGNAILDSLQPGMVYVGGTDNGRWVPELLNETSDNPHIIVTQNALADGTYLDFVRELYGDQFNTLTADDSQRAFQEYTADAEKRLQHDRDFPDEPKQVRPGENIKMVDGKVQVSGVTSVMAINEKLLQILMQKNPDLSFAMQESFPLPGLYADAAPLGPLMQLCAAGSQNTFTAEGAAQSLDYWRTATDTLLVDPAAVSEYALRSYSHDINSTANLLAAHSYTTEAEQAYRLSTQIWPGNPDATEGLATILVRAGRAAEARQLLDTFARNNPDQRSAIDSFRGTITWTAKASN